MLALLALVVRFGLAAWIAFLFPQELLCVDSGPAIAQAILVLGGESKSRPRQAAVLFHQGCAPRIIVSGWDAYRQVLLASGVPDRSIQLEKESRNTKEN